MIFGIDLGTTNSLIGYSDEYLSDLVPSIASLEKRIAGASLKEDYSAVRSFKPNISLGVEGILPIKASSLVLQELVNQSKTAGYNVKDVVISVPADFNDNQRSATWKAATDIGLNVKGLINEPTAAALKIAKDTKALLLVFDLGGGTFDVSVIDSRFGAYDVQDTDGKIVGGDNLDHAIRRNFIKEANIAIHHLGKERLNKLTAVACAVKIRMQKERKDIPVDLTEFGGGVIELKEETYKTLVRMTFQDALTKTKNVVARSIDFGEKYKLLFVGGSTRCPYLQEWICSELGVEAEKIDYDPDKIVAQGAAVYAKMIEEEVVDEMVSDVTKRLSVGLADGTSQTIIDKNSKIPIAEERLFYNQDIADKLELKLYQGDSALASNNECIGTLIYEYKEVKPAGMGEVIVGVSVERDGIIEFTCQELCNKKVSIKLQRK